MSDPAVAPERGDLVWIGFNHHAGHEQAGRRPGLVLSPAAYNGKVGSALLCPITSRVKGYPFEVVLPDGLPVHGAVLCDQVGGSPGTTGVDDERTSRFGGPAAMHERNPTLYFGARLQLVTGDVVPPSGGFVHCTPNLDAAIWAAELSDGDEEARVYEVAATGALENVGGRPGDAQPAHPAMSWRSGEPVKVRREVADWTHYHGTRARFEPGDVIEPGHSANHGARPRVANYVYFARTLDAAMWAAELAAGDGGPDLRRGPHG